MSFLKPSPKTPLGIYIHIPFCRSKCQYCDFYSLTECPKKVGKAYRQALGAHIQDFGALSRDYLVDTVYFGGGTPSFFGAGNLCAILRQVRRAFRVSPTAEITFEANPDSVTPGLLRRLRREGFNRVSLGVQCDDDEILKKIGRPHTYAQAVEAVAQIRKAGFKNLSLDLIYGLPGQTREGWNKTLENVLALNPEHISCYGLKVEEGTPLYAVRDTCGLPDDEAQADMYLSAVEILRKKGYRQYEISNFSRRGLESRHNLKYWLGGEYLGFGPDASSDYAGKRFKMVRDLQGYLDGVAGKGPLMAEQAAIPPQERAAEYLMLGLRTVRGIRAGEYESRFLLPFGPIEEALEVCRSRGHALRTEDGWRLTPEGMLLSNAILSDLLLVQERSGRKTR